MKSSILSLILVLTAALVFSPPVQAGDTRSYNPHDTIETSHPNWMSWVPDDKRLSELSLPGTHDTMAQYGGDLVETNELGLREQLDAGIRAVDIRCRHIEDTFTIHHGSVFQHAYFGEDVLKVCHEFLQANPTETILMRVTEEYDAEDNTRHFGETFEWYRTQTTYGSVIWPIYPGYTNQSSGNYHRMPTLGEVRGKVVVLQGTYDADGDPNYGLLANGSDFTTIFVIHQQDLWDLTYTSDRDDKWDYAKSFLRYTDGDDATFTSRESLGADETVLNDPANPLRLYVNRLSASSSNGGVYPNAVAMYVNPRALQYLFKRSQTRTTGLILMDFPGEALISAIIAHNLKYATNDADRAKFRASFQTIFNDSCYALYDKDYADYSLTSRATELQLWLGHILPWRGPQGIVRDHWSVIVKEGDQGNDNWAVVTGESSGQSLFKQSESIDDRSYVALNSISRADTVTTSELQSYLLTGPTLKPELSTTMGAAGDCLGRAQALKLLVRKQFPGVKWNVAVSRNAPLGTALDTLASCVGSAVSSGSIYFYYVWAGSDNPTAPVPRAGGPYTAAEGEAVLFDAGATTDLDHNAALTYRWDFDNNGTWDVTTSATTASQAFGNQGTYTVRLQVSDGENAVETTTSVTVSNVAPALNLGAPTADMLTGDSFSRACFFTDSGSDTWTVTVNYGDGTPTQNISHTNKAFNLGHNYSSAGTRTVTVTVNDGTTSTQGTIAVTVAAAGPPMVKSFTGPSGPVPEGSAVTVSGSFYYGVWSQTLSIAWGDGSPNTQPTVLATGGGNYTFTAQHTYADLPPGGAGQYTVTATWPTWTTRTLPVTVVDVPPAFSSLTFPASVPEGTLVQVGYTINAPTQDVLIKKVDWGDGTNQTWTGGSLTSISPPHTYTTAGTYLMTISVTDEDHSTGVETRTVTVTDAAPTIFDFIQTSSGVKEGITASVLGHFQSTNLASDQFTVEIDWGDGRPPTTALYHSVGANTAEFSAAHVYYDNNGTNPWTATVKVTDDDGSVVTGTVAIPVGNQQPVVDAVPNFSIPSNSVLSKSGHITDPGSDTFTGTVNYGDGTGTQPLSIIGNSYQLDHTYAANNVYTITVNVTDDDGAGDSRTMKVLVGPVRDLLVTNTNNSGPGSLRQAVLDANTPSTNSTTFPLAFADIRFAPALSGQTITLTSGQLLSSLRTRMDASSLAVGIKVSGNNTSRILQVALNNSVVLDSIHLTGGSTPLGGGAIQVDSEAGLTLNRCTISNCTTTDRGGGIAFVKGSALKLVQCTVSGCAAKEGGGIHFYGLGGKELRVENSTFSGNAALGASSSAGGAIFNLSGRVVMNHSTIAGNSAAGTSSKGGGIHSSNDAALEANYSIVAGNTGASLANISGPSSGTGNFTSGDPQLLPLGNYGGLTATMPPRPGSPAIDAITSVDVPMYTTHIAWWRMGEEDAAAANGGTTTTTSNPFGGALTFNYPVTYSSAVSPTAAGWLDSRLGVTLAPGVHGTTGLVADFLGDTAITDNFGIELWVKPNDTIGAKCLAYNGNTVTNGWGLYQLGDSYSGLFGGVTFIGFGSAPVTPGTWTHLALVRDGGVARFYVNGQLVDSVAAAPNAPAGRFAVGAQPQSLGAEFFAGALDEVRVFTFNPGQFSPDGLSYQPKPPAGISYLPGSGGASAYSATWSNDQRGYPRVSGVGADIGAVEVEQTVVRQTGDTGAATLRQNVADISPAGIIGFAPALAGKTITLGSEIVISKVVSIDAGSLPAGVTIDGGPGTNRVFSVNPGQTVFLIALTLTGGNSGGTDMPQHGGALFNRGALTLRRCTFAGNTASYGGVLFNDFAGTLMLDQCTLSGNSATVEAGAIYHRGVSMLVHHCTISGNQAPVFGAIYNDDSNAVSLTNTILAGNTGSDGADLHNRGTLTRIGGNMLTGYVQFGVGSSTGPAAISNTPLLAPLGYYGGPTPTMALMPGSPARNAAVGSTITSDQRGFPIVGTPDIGAYEAGTLSNFGLWSIETTGLYWLDFGVDMEHDGAVNGFEYATRRDPFVSDVPLSPTLTANPGGGHVFTFRYLTDARDLRYIVQRSAELTLPGSGWTEIYRYDSSTGLVTENGITGTENPGTQLITIVDTTVAPKLFWRLRIERVP